MEFKRKKKKTLPPNKESKKIPLPIHLTMFYLFHLQIVEITISTVRAKLDLMKEISDWFPWLSRIPHLAHPQKPIGGHVNQVHDQPEGPNSLPPCESSYLNFLFRAAISHSKEKLWAQIVGGDLVQGFSTGRRKGFLLLSLHHGLDSLSSSPPADVKRTSRVPVMNDQCHC